MGSHRPIRTCVGCHRRRNADQLVRVGRTRDGRLDVGQTLPGRGAWLCVGNQRCLRSAGDQRAFDRAFRTKVNQADLDYLRERWEHLHRSADQD